MNLSSFLKVGALVAGLSLFFAAPSQARDHHDRHDHDHRGGNSWFERNTLLGRTINSARYSHGGHYYGGSRYYGHGYGYGGYRYYRPYAYDYYDPYPSVSFSYVSRPSYVRSYGGSLTGSVQRELRSRGYYRGYVDGLMGPGTRNALRNFQADQGLRITGRIDSDTLDELDLD